MRTISVIGSGYVGLVTGACFAELGNSVICVDIDQEKIAGLVAGSLPFYEPGLLEMVSRNHSSGRLRFTTDFHEGLSHREIVFLAVGTPQGNDGRADLRFVRNAAVEIARHLDSDRLVVNKSTVPVETGDLVSSIIREHARAPFEVRVVSNPEFLREGSAINDFMHPDRIVIGASDQHAAEVMRQLYAPLNAPVIVTDVRTAEMIKYTANAFLATRISFVNEIANICDRVGADIKSVVAGAGSDKRIGTAFMSAGLGFGGSCFPKDVTALSRIAESYGVESSVLEAVLAVNRRQIVKTAQRMKSALGGLRGKRIAIFGLSFKPNTDDIRESPAVALIEFLLQADASITATDPVAIKAVLQTQVGSSVRFEIDLQTAARDADAIVVATDWNEYKQLNLAELRMLMRDNLFVDARNLYEPSAVVGAGLRYLGVGRGNVEAMGAKPAADGPSSDGSRAPEKEAPTAVP